MRRLLAPLLLLGALALTPSPASAGTCTGGTVEVAGRVTDAVTGLRLAEVTSVEFEAVGGGAVSDGFGTLLPSSRWDDCVEPGDYTLSFHADSYRPEWWEDTDIAHADVISITPSGDFTGLDAALTPRGRVLAGQITSVRGRALDASIGIWRLTSAGWRSIDGIGNDHATGRWSYRVPALGRYRVSAFVDHYSARWYDGDLRLRDARVLIVTASTDAITGVDIALPYCPASTGPPCVPPNFNR